MNKHEINEENYLKRYDSNHYAKPAVTVDVLVFASQNTEIINGLDILLIKRKHHPFRDCWALPGGFVNMDEGLKAAALRELKEETSISETNIYLEQLHAYGDVQRDPRMRVISIAYVAVTNAKNITVKANDDAKEARWFHVNINSHNLELINSEKDVRICYINEETWQHDGISDQLAFDHQKIILDGIKQIMEDRK